VRRSLVVEDVLVNRECAHGEGERVVMWMVWRIRQPLHFDGLSWSAHAGTEFACMSYVTVETSVIGEMEECSLSVVFSVEC
jgi:hypothetical protein